MSGGYEFDPEAARRVEKGLKDAITELEEVGYFSITSQQGHGFSRMSLSGMTLGDAALAAKFEEFCDRWGAAVQEKIHDANQLAVGLGLNAGRYHEQEQYVVGSLKELTVTGTSFNPATGMSASEDAAGKSWEQIRQEALYEVAREKPTDDSLPEFDEMSGQWQQVGDDASTSPFVGGGDGDGREQQRGSGGTN